MPYSPGGIFSLVASYFANPGTTIRTEQHNPVFEDVASALSQVLLRDGRAPMTGALNMNGFAINGVAPGSASGSVATLAQSMPIGSVIDYALKTLPAGWSPCIGQVLLANTTYTTLRNLLIADGFPYGQDGSGNPKLPDARGCVTACYDSAGGVPAGRLNGSFGQIVGSQTRVIDRTQLPPVQIGVNASGGFSANSGAANYMYTPNGTLNITGAFQPGNSAVVGVPGANSGQVTVTGSVAVAGATDALGSGAPLDVAQSTLIMNKIIRVSYDV